MRHNGIYLLLLICVTLGGCSRSPSLPADQGQSIAEAFLNEIKSGKVDNAWQETTPEFKSLMGKEAFRDYVKRRPALKSEIKFESSKANQNTKMKLVEFQFRAEKPKPSKITIMLSPSESSWRVERLVAD
jgi:hypothetical protein